jgi:hypothetical protein
MSSVKYLSITDDGWTSKANDSYMITTAHWVSDDFESHFCVLSVRPMQQAHTAAEITRVVRDCFCLSSDSVGKIGLG